MQRSTAFINLSNSRVVRYMADHVASLRWFLVTALAAAIVVGGTHPAYGESAAAAAFEPKIAKGHILVGKKKTSAQTDFDAAVTTQGGHSVGSIANLGIQIVSVAPGKEKDTAARLKGNKHVEFAEVDQQISAAATVNDPNVGSEWHIAKINAPQAWDYTLGSGVTIAILDTGVDGSHPDLAGQMVAGWNFYDNNANTADVNGHGTAVAGAAAAASNNGIGVASVAGAAHIMPVRIADPNGYAYWSTVAQGINYAADHGARVVNLSYEGASGSSAIQSAASYLRSKGGVLFVAAGNTGAVDNTAPTNLMMVVSATNETDALASFSTFGSFVAISAPGNNIMTTAMGGAYQYWWGTSLATPVVAGTAALILAKRPDFTPAQVDATLKSTAVDLGPHGAENYFGAGRVNAGAAVAAAASSTPGDTTPPTVAIASPTGGTVSGTVTVSVNASDNIGVSRVELRVNGATVASDTTAPYTFAWNSATVANGAVMLTAVAYDAAGNSATSAAVSVNVSNGPPPDTTPPTVALTSPKAGATITGQITVAATASDNVGVTRVDFRANGATIATTNTAPYQFNWTSTLVPNGVTSVTAVAFDAAGNSRTSAAVSVTINNPPSGGPVGGTDTTPPVLTITNPVNGSLVTGTVSIKTSASDNSGAAGIKQTLYIDGVKKATASGASLSYNWNAKKATSGSHTIVVTAIDAATNSATSTVVVTRK